MVVSQAAAGSRPTGSCDGRMRLVGGATAGPALAVAGASPGASTTASAATPITLLSFMDEFLYELRGTTDSGQLWLRFTGTASSTSPGTSTRLHW